MSIKKLTGILILIVALLMGCSGNYGNIKTQSETDSEVTQQELIDNWSDFHISFDYRNRTGLTLIVFDPKNDDRKILVGSKWVTVENQEMWTEIVKEHTTSEGNFSLNRNYYGTTGVREILGPDNQLYGFIIHRNTGVAWVNVKQVDENTMQLSWQRTPIQGTPL